MKKIYPIGRFIYPPLWTLFVKKVNGVENIPKDKGLIFCPNHASYIDDPIPHTKIGIPLNRHVHPMVNSRFYKNKLIAWFLNWCKCIPIHVRKDMEGKDYSNDKSFKIAKEYLKKNEIIVIFPEGTRSKDGTLREGKDGASILAIETNTPIVPIGIIGSYEIMPKGAIFPRFGRRCIVNIGKPIDVSKYKLKDKKELTTKVMKEIARLSKQDYRW